MDQHQAVPLGVGVEGDSQVGVQFFGVGGCGGFGDDVRVVVGEGQRGVDEELGDADAAEFFEDGEAAEGDEAFAAVVDGGFDC